MGLKDFYPNLTLKYQLFTTDSLCRNNNIDDYFQEDGVCNIIASEINLSIATKILLIHGLIEHILTEEAGIPESVIDAYDKEFEDKIQKGIVSEDAEPGEQEDCPYKDQHYSAEVVERILCDRVKLSWRDYTNLLINKLKSDNLLKVID